MAFNANDLYLVSGNAGLSNNWVDSISKFTPTSFYNWEQDNEPLHDLDDRTTMLWERAGYPTQNGVSGITGKVYVVSADAPFVQDSSGVIFKDLQTVFDSLPTVITHPIIIEIASSGNLGDVCLRNVKVGDGCNGAGIEIINRMFARDYGLSSTLYKDSTTALSSLEVINELLDTKSTLLDINLVSSIVSPVLTKSRGWIVKQPFGRSAYSTPNIVINRRDTLATLTTDSFPFAGSYISVNDNTTLIGATSVSRPALANTEFSNGAVYLNHFASFSIENCTGPIYIRNICVDGGFTTQTGMSINNSHGIVFDNLMVLGCYKYGIDANNSELKFRRSLICARNYNFPRNVSDQNSAGLRATNSTLSVDLVTTTGGPTLYGANSPFIFAHQAIGLDLINSKFEGGSFPGASGVASAISLSSSPTIIQSMYNTVYGVKMTNSVFNHAGILEVINNSTGIKCENSQLHLPMFVCEYNNTVGFDATNCNIRINPEMQKYNSGATYGNGTENYSQWFFNKNFQHLKLQNSTWQIAPTRSKIAEYTGTSFFLSSYGDDSFASEQTTLPAIVVQKNSFLQIPHIYSKVITGVTFKNANPVLGACISVTDNSKALVQGSKYGSNQFVGSPSFNNNVALVYCNNNSTFEANGNTLFCQAAINCLADNNSVISFKPHTNDNGTLAVSSWELSSADSHTRIELHSYRSNIVVDNGSVFDVENLGDYRALWAASAASSVQAPVSESYKTYTSGGYLQFYPNPQDSNTVTSYSLTPTNFSQYGDYSNSHKYFLTSPTDATGIASISNGGMCVRALNGSKVRVFNTNLPAGWANTKGIYFDVSSTECEKLRIWNIGAGSYLTASYLSVSGGWPTSRGVSYFGPSAYWYTSAGAIVSGYFAQDINGESTSLSRLDSFGSGTGYSTGFGGDAGNFGPFRLYFSPHSSAKYLVTSSASGTDMGVPYQVLSQGYNPSTVCYFSDYNEFFASPINGLYSSGGSFVTDVYKFLDSGYADRIKLDWSAAHTFANACHNAFTTPDIPGVPDEDYGSGATSDLYVRRKKLVSIFSTKTNTTPGSESHNSAAGYGRGFLSSDTFDIRRDN
jgi:hypothetical protein